MKSNLKNILDKTANHVTRLREKHTKTPELGSMTVTNRNIRKITFDSKQNDKSLNYDLNDRLSTNRMNSSITGTTSDASPFG